MDGRTELVYTFGPFRLDPRERLLLCGGKPVPLTPRAFDMLLVLVQNGGRLVAKDALLKQVWPDTFVEEGNLTKYASTLRKTLAAFSEGTEYIETVPKRGYRFIAAVKAEPVSSSDGRGSQLTPSDHLEETEAGPPGGASPEPLPEVKRRKWARLGWVVASLAVVAAPAWLATPWSRHRRSQLSGRGGIHSLAVLPFLNLSRDPAEECLTQGTTAELITALSQLQDLRVISLTSALRYQGTAKSVPQIAQELGVDAVVEGTMLESRGRVRITCQLVQAFPEKLVWADSYERATRDVMALQAELAHAIAGEIKGALSPFEQQRLTGLRR